MSAYICDTGSFLPNRPILNDEMEDVLGKVSGLSSRVRRIILRNNGIRQRHYALDPDTGRITHTNAELTAEAIRRLQPGEGGSLPEIACLCCGTSSPDQFFPGHASMVHGLLGGKPMEVASTAGVCVSGVAALKYAWMSVAGGHAKNAVATGSDVGSTFLRSSYFEHSAPLTDVDPETTPALAFNAEFLRWMLSDGAGALFLARTPVPGRRSLRIDWIDIISYAHEHETCMYAGAVKQESGRLTGWREFPTLRAAAEANAFAVQQDVRLLNDVVVGATVGKGLADVMERRSLRPEAFDWFLPHYSSAYFREKVGAEMARIGFGIPYEKWFTNLATVGNIGAASIYVMLDALFRSGSLQEGQRILCFVPESGRFSVGYIGLTVTG